MVIVSNERIEVGVVQIHPVKTIATTGTAQWNSSGQID